MLNFRNHEKIRVLVVEDNPLVREVSVSLLNLLNCETVEAEDGKSALDLLCNGAQFDLLFSDIVMPGDMNGIKLAEAARSHNPTLKVLLTSGYTRDALPVSSAQVPECQILCKPFSLSQLTDALRQLIPERTAAVS